MKTFPLQRAVAVAVAFTGFVQLAPRAYGQGGVALWTNLCNWPGDPYCSPRGMAVDSAGDVFVTGWFDSSSSSAFGTVAYSSAGVPLWTNRAQNTQAYGVAVDGSGNVFVTGAGATIKYSGVGIPLWTNFSSAGFYAIVLDAGGNVIVTGELGCGYGIIKYSGAGVPLWTNSYTGGYCDNIGRAVAVDSSGNVFVTGQSANATGTDEDYATIKYSSAGVPLWTKRYNGPGNGADLATAIAIDSSGNAVVTGYSTGSSGSYEFATIKYSGAGVPLWTNRYHGPGNGDDLASGIALDASGNVFVAGSSHAASGASGLATIKYSGAGVPLWTNLYSATNYGSATSVVTDNRGNVFVTGWLDSDCLTIAYSNAGVPLWTNRYNAAQGIRVAVDGSGNVLVTGEKSNGSSANYVTIKYSSSIPPVPYLGFELQSGQLVLSWTNAALSLQDAPDAAGTYTNIPDATSPYTNSLTAPQQFFRVIGN
jgi:hypothetical protein